MTRKPGLYPSVTQILSPWADFSGVPPHVLAAASERGTRVHQACLTEAVGGWVMADELVAPYLASFQKWLPRVEVIAVEFEVTDHTMGYLGHPDLLVRFKGDQGYSLIDLKTPRVYNPIWRAQLAAYKGAALTMPEYSNIQRLASLRLSPEGKPPILNESTATYALDLNGFYNSLAAWKYFQGLKRKEF